MVIPFIYTQEVSLNRPGFISSRPKVCFLCSLAHQLKIKMAHVLRGSLCLNDDSGRFLASWPVFLSPCIDSMISLRTIDCQLV